MRVSRSAAVLALLLLAASSTGASMSGLWGGITANQIRPVEERMYTSPQWGSSSVPLPATTRAAQYAKRVRVWEAVLLRRAAWPVYANATSGAQLLQELLADLRNISSEVQQHVWPDRHKHRQRIHQPSSSSSGGSSGGGGGSQLPVPSVAPHAAAGSPRTGTATPAAKVDSESTAAAATTAAAAATGAISDSTSTVAPVHPAAGGPDSAPSTSASGPLPTVSPSASASAASDSIATASSTSSSTGPSVAAGVLPWQEASRAAYLLSVLSASGLLPGEVLPRDNAWQLEHLHTAARAGSIDAQLALADRAFTGRGEAPDCSRGMHYLKAAAASLAARVEQEGRFQHPGHVAHLRERWINQRLAGGDAWEVPGSDDGPQVVEVELDAALNGDLRALRTMGYRRLVGRGMDANPAAALQDFAAAARLGDPYAMFNLGYMHLKGIHVPQNTSQAVNYFQQAASRGLAAGHNGLGVLAFHGQGVQRDLAAAKAHFEAGAAQGSADSMYNLGGMHMEGLGVPRNVTEAMLWYDKAYAQGHWRAPYSLALLYDPAAPLLYPSCAIAERLLWQFVAERSDWSTQLRLAQAQESLGLDWPALLRYLLLAEQGCEVAQANAGFMLLQGRGAGGKAALHLSAQMLMRSSLLNATDSMVQLAALLQEHPWLQGSASQPGSMQARTPSPPTDAPAASPAAAAADGAPPASSPPATAPGQQLGGKAVAGSSSSRQQEDGVAHMDVFYRAAPAKPYDPVYGGPTPYTRGHSFGVWLAPAASSKGKGKAGAAATSSSYSSDSYLFAGSAPFPRTGYGHPDINVSMEEAGHMYDMYDDDDDDEYGGQEYGVFIPDGPAQAMAAPQASKQAPTPAAPAAAAAGVAQPAAAAATASMLQPGAVGDPPLPVQPPVTAAAVQVLRRPPGVATDVLWLQQAADLGDTEAVLALAWRYVAGDGVQRNLTVARELLAWSSKVEWDSYKRVPLFLARHALRVLSMLHALGGTRALQGALHSLQAVRAQLWGASSLSESALTAPSAYQQLVRDLDEAVVSAALRRALEEAVAAANAASGADRQRRGAANAGAGLPRPSEEVSTATQAGVAATGALGAQQQQQQQQHLTTPGGMRTPQQQQVATGAPVAEGGAGLGLEEHLGFGEMLGLDRVDPENLAMTVLLGMLAGVLWLRQRQLQPRLHPHHRRRTTDDDEDGPVPPPLQRPQEPRRRSPLVPPQQQQQQQHEAGSLHAPQEASAGEADQHSSSAAAATSSSSSEQQQGLRQRLRHGDAM